MADEKNHQDNPFWSTFRELATSPHVLFSVLGIAVVAALGYGIYSAGGQFLDSLQKTEVARGLITFLIAVATVAIAIILALYVVVSTGTELKERFALGKEILTTLIGVLGTIVGFYFGSSTEIQSRETKKISESKPQVLQIAPVSISSEKPKKGDSISIASFIYGGKPPYYYTVSFSPANVLSPVSKTTQDGSIKEEIKLADTIEKDKELSLKIEVKDDEGKSAILEDKTKKLIITE